MDYRAIVEGLPGLFMILDADLAIVEVSDAYARATLIRRDDVLGCPLFEVFPDNPGDPAADGVRNLKASLERVMRMRAPDTMAVQRYDVRRPDEQGGGFDERYWTVINSPVFDAAGRVAYIIHKAEDVTEFIRHNANEGLEAPDERLDADIYARTREVAATSAQLKSANLALDEARIRAEAANRAKSAFLATMSHEIRTPMHGVLGMVNLLRRSPLDYRQRHYLDLIQASGEHLLAIINDILDFSKIEAGKVELVFDDFLLDDLLREAWSLVGERARAKQLRHEASCSHPGLAVRGDKTRLMQALLNLLGNAVKFTEQGGITLSCRVEHESEAGCQLRFEVADTGIGMSDEQQARVFNVFEQADSSTSRKYQGTGLGLAITRRIAQLMGGETGVTSALGQGSTFWFTCRVGRGQAPRPAPALPTGGAEALLVRDYRGRRVLVVDDEPVNREVAGFMLEDVGLVVDMARDGLEALAKVQQERYDIVLMDMQMPGLNGLDATRQLRALPGLHDLVIIALTANAFDDDRQRCLAAGMDDFIAKPFSPEGVFEKLLRWLRDPGRAGSRSME